MAKTQHPTALLYIGAAPEAVSELRQAINDILASGAEQKTLRAALEVLGKGVSVNGTTIHDCIFNSREDR